MTMNNTMNKLKEFERDVELFWHCESRNRTAASDLHLALSNDKHPISLEEFNLLLDVAIRTRKYSVEEYEMLIGADFENADEVADDLNLLREELRACR